MSIYWGGYIPGFTFRLNAQSADPKIITFAQSGVSTGRFLDSTFTQLIYSGNTIGSQFLVQVVPEKTVIWGENPIVSLSTDNTGIATIDSAGNVSYVNSGKFNAIGSYQANSYYSGLSISIPLVNVVSGSNFTTGLTYTDDAVNVSNHVLVVYNINSTTSLNLKDYYTGHRPQFGSANILGISCPSGSESITYSGFTGNIRKPIADYITGLSGSGSKFIRYVVLMSDIPTRVSDTNLSSVSFQLVHAFQQLGLRNGADYTSQNGHFSLAKYQQNTCLVSHINFATYQDCTSYIDRISAGQTGIYLSGNGNNTGYFFEDAGNIYANPWVSGRHLQPLLQQFPSVPYVYRPYVSGVYNHIPTGYGGVAGYSTWGTNGNMAWSYSFNGEVRWAQNNNNWYIMNSIESFNGQRNLGPGGQSSFLMWMASGAFGGSGYENCPVGAAGHVEEPYLGGTENTGYFTLWNSGYPFIECAWQGRLTPFYAVFGDPLVVK